MTQLSVTYIGVSVFYGCRSLASVTIPNSVTYIGDHAFCRCSSLASVTIPGTVTSIGDGSFYGCSSLSSVTIPEGVTSIGDRAFYGCSSLENVNYTSSEADWASITIGTDNEPLTNATINYNYRKVLDVSLSAESMKITKGKTKTLVATVEAGLDANTSVTWSSDNEAVATVDETGKVTAVAIGDATITATTVEGGYSASCSVKVAGAVLASGSCGTKVRWSLEDETYVLTISGTGAMADYTASSVPWYSYRTYIKTVIIEEGITKIGDCAFNYFGNLTSVTIPDTVTSMGEFAFYGCKSLESIEIPATVTSIETWAFYNCNNLETVYFKGTHTQWNNIAIGGNNGAITTATIHFEAPKITLDGVEVETDGSIALGTDNGDGTYSLPENVVGYYIDDKFVDAGVYDVTGGEVITTVDFNVTMVKGAQVRYGGGLDENGKVTSGNGLRFLAQVDRSNFDGSVYGMKLTAEGSDKETIVKAEKWQNDDATFTVALTDIAESNYIRKFTATPYVVVKYDDGTEKTIYGTESVTRSIYQVSAGLLKSDEETEEMLIEVLNAYANQSGIRLVVKDGELKANTNYTKSGAYALGEDELHFVVSDAAYDYSLNTYSVILTAQGKAEIVTDNDFWYDYIRINNNNSLIRDKVTIERVEGNEKAVKVTFCADGLIERKTDTNDNTTTDPGDGDFDGEAEWN